MSSCDKECRLAEPSQADGLIEEIRSSVGDKKIELRNQFILSYTGLVRHWVKRLYPRMASRHEKRDLEQAGFVALWDALDRYNGSSKFATYASWRIKTSIRKLDSNRKIEYYAEPMGHPGVLSEAAPEAEPCLADIWDCLRDRPMIDRVILRIIFGWSVEQMSQTELSKVTGWSRKFIINSLHRTTQYARNKLAEK